MQKECQQAHRKYLSDILNSPSGKSQKNLWSYVKGKRHDQVSIPSLKVNGITVSDAQEKTKLFNQQFTSVFTDENTSTLPDLGVSPFNTIVVDDIHVDGVTKLFANLQGPWYRWNSSSFAKGNCTQHALLHCSPIRI